MYALSTKKNVIGMNSQTGDYVNDAKAKMYVHIFWRKSRLVLAQVQ